MDEIRINVSRQPVEHLDVTNVTSIGASYTHIKSLKNIIGSKTKRIVMYHSFIESLAGFEDTDYVDIVYLGFNRIKYFREQDSKIKSINVLDLAGNPLVSLKNCPPCKTLIVSSTLITDLEGVQEGTEIIRCGHSTHLRSLKGCPKSVKLIECSCTPNLIIDKNDLPNNGDGLELLM